MEKWICRVCGYTYHGEEAPERCPVCGASRYRFYAERGSYWKTIRYILIIVILITIFCAFFACRSTLTVDNSTVNTLDLYRYMGKWYEIARYDHSFERDMTHCMTTYTLRDNGTILVTNKGKKNGKWKTSTGKAKLTKDPGVLRVSFFGPFYSDYRVLMLAPDYSYALVGGSSDDYLWILSRTPQLKQDSRNLIVSEIQRRGYDAQSLIWVEHQDQLYSPH